MLRSSRIKGKKEKYFKIHLNRVKKLSCKDDKFNPPFTKELTKKCPFLKKIMPLPIALARA